MGEDTYLAGELAGSMVRGMIGGDVSNLTRPDTVSPLLKHYAAHSIPENGRNTGPVHIGMWVRVRDNCMYMYVD